MHAEKSFKVRRIRLKQLVMATLVCKELIVNVDVNTDKLRYNVNWRTLD